MNQVHCPKCKKTITSDYINIKHMTANCDQCHILFNITGTGSAEPRPSLPMPEKFNLIKSNSGLEINWKWFVYRFIFFAFFTVAWFAGLAMFYSGIIGSGDPPLMLLLFPIAHLAAGVFLGYYTLAGFLNTTTISLKRGLLTISHRPLPWRGQGTINADQISQLYCKRRVQRGKNGVQITYRVIAIMKNTSSKVLIYGLENEEQALFIEQEIETFLNITDRPIPGEIK